MSKSFVKLMKMALQLIPVINASYMGYFDYLVYVGGGEAKKPPCQTLAFDFRQS